MQRDIARANVEHYLRLLKDEGLAPEKRNVLLRLVIAEEDTLGVLEHLDFADAMAEAGRDRLARAMAVRETFAAGSPEREQSDILLANLAETQALLDDVARRLRERAGLTRPG